MKGTNGTNVNRATEELLTVSRFTLVGVGASLIHIGLVWILIVQFDINPIRANLAAFLTAFGFSFAGQYLWTFRSARHWRSALVRFFIVSIAAFALNNIALLGLLQLDHMRSSFAAVLAACVVPLASYVLGRTWAFR